MKIEFEDAYYLAALWLNKAIEMADSNEKVTFDEIMQWNRTNTSGWYLIELYAYKERYFPDNELGTLELVNRYCKFAKTNGNASVDGIIAKTEFLENLWPGYVEEASIFFADSFGIDRDKAYSGKDFAKKISKAFAELEEKGEEFAKAINNAIFESNRKAKRGDDSGRRKI